MLRALLLIAVGTFLIAQGTSTWQMPDWKGKKPTAAELSTAVLKTASMAAATGETDMAVALKAMAIHAKGKGTFKLISGPSDKPGQETVITIVSVPAEEARAPK